MDNKKKRLWIFVTFFVIGIFLVGVTGIADSISLNLLFAGIFGSAGVAVGGPVGGVVGAGVGYGLVGMPIVNAFTWIISIIAGAVGFVTGFFSAGGHCEAFQPPATGTNCDSCNDNPLQKCTEYKCRSLGRYCQFVESTGVSGSCVYSPPKDSAEPNVVSCEKVEEYSSKDTQVQEVGNSCNVVFPEYSDLILKLKTDENAVCSGADNPDMENSFPFGINSERGLFSTEHDFIISLGEISDNILNACGELDGNCAFYVKCSDFADNVMETPYVVNIKFVDAPDIVPPTIIESTLHDGERVLLGATKIDDFELIVTDKSGVVGCKYSNQANVEYYSMLNSVSCTSDNDANYVCKGDIDLLPGKKTDIYFRCVDKVGNANTQDYHIGILPGDPLKITDVNLKDGDNLTGNEDLIVKTSGGYENGKAECSYDYSFVRLISSLSGSSTGSGVFNITNATQHTLDLGFMSLDGSYQINFQCLDSFKNKDEKSIGVVVKSDPLSMALTSSVSNRNISLNVVTSGGVDGKGRGDCSYKLLNAGETVNDLGYGCDTASVNCGLLNSNSAKTAHSAVIPNVGDGNYNYGVVCRSFEDNTLIAKGVAFVSVGTAGTVQPPTPQPPPGPQPPLTSCVLTQANWLSSATERAISKITSNEETILYAKGRDCADNLDVKFELYRDIKYGNDIKVTDIDSKFADGEVAGFWNALYDGDDRLRGYYFKVVVNDKEIRSGNLVVEKASCTIGNSCEVAVKSQQCDGKFDTNCNCVDIPNDNCPAGEAEEEPVVGQIPITIISPSSGEVFRNIPVKFNLEIKTGNEKLLPNECIYSFKYGRYGQGDFISPFNFKLIGVDPTHLSAGIDLYIVTGLEQFRSGGAANNGEYGYIVRCEKDGRVGQTQGYINVLIPGGIAPPVIGKKSTLQVNSFGPTTQQTDTNVELFITLRNGPSGYGKDAECRYTDVYSNSLIDGYSSVLYPGVLNFAGDVVGGATKYSKTLTNLNTGPHEYFIKCKDSDGGLTEYQPIKFEIKIPSSKQLSIVRTSPSGIYGSRNVVLEVESNGGIDNGANVKCKYSGIGDGDFNAGQQITGGRYKHNVTIANVADGSYTVNIECSDRANQIDAEAITFTVKEDKIKPEIQQIITRGSSKYIMIDETAICEASSDNINWGAVSKDTQNGKKHLVTLTGGYYFRCSDPWGNNMDVVRINP